MSASKAAGSLPWYLRSNGPRHLKTYLGMINMKPPMFLAPNLKELHLHKFARQPGTPSPRCRSNEAMYDLVLKHLLAFRWSNPNALTYLHEHRTTTGESAYVTYELWDGRTGKFSVKPGTKSETVLAKVMFAARDPEYDPEEYKELMASRRVAAGLSPETPTMTQAEVLAAQDAELLARHADGTAAGAQGAFAASTVPRTTVAAAEASPVATSTTPRWVEYPAEEKDVRNLPPSWIPGADAGASKASSNDR